MYDCAIIGGGPAGLSAALVLGRARRSVMLFDNNNPRNAVTQASHGFLTRDGVSPMQLRELAQEELSPYPSVHRQACEIAAVTRTETGFQLQSFGGRTFEARKVILATGLKEALPQIPGLPELYGTSVFNCPYCDGWEWRDKPLVQVSEEKNAYSYAMLLHNWSRDLIVCTNGADSLTLKQQEALLARGIAVYTQPVAAFAGSQGRLARIKLADGTFIPREAGFVSTRVSQRTAIGERLGCRLNEAGGIAADAFGRTSVEGVYAAGDTSVVAPSQLVIAAAEGTRAAMGVNMDLSMEAFGDKDLQV